MSNMKAPTNGFLENPAAEGERKPINSELWHACAGPLVSLPPVGSLVVYFPQGHSEQVAASMQKETDFIPSYPNLPSNLICMLHNVTMQADPETDEVYAQMTLQPVQKCDKEALLASELALKQNRQPTEFFCKTLTASDTSTHGGFSVPRRAAEKIFPPLDYSMQPPAQEIVAKDLHDHTWTFKHIYRGQPKRHLLTTGWSVCVSTKRLYAGDSVLFIRDDKQQLFLGIKRANRQQPALSSSVISSDSMHIGILAAAAHAAANNSPFTIFYNPRAPSEFVVPFAKYQKAMYTRVSLGMRFRMMFETEDSGVRRYMGTITGISDMDPLRWKGSQWRNLQVGWDESTAGERPGRVSLWEIEPVVTPFYICPPPFFRPKLPGQPGVTEDGSDMESAFRRAMPWLGDDLGMKDAPNSMFPGLSLVQWMSMQQNNPFSGIQSGFLPSMGSSNPLHNNPSMEDLSKLLSFQAPAINTSNLQFNKANSQNHVSQLRQSSMAWPQQQMQKLLQSPLYQQQQNGQQQQAVSQVIQQQAPQQPQQQQQLQQQPQQPQMLQASNNGVLNSNYAQNQCLQRPMFNSQLREQLVTSNIQLQQGIHSSNMSSFHLPSLPQNLQVQQNAEQANLLQKNNQQTPSQQSPLQLQQSVSQKSQHLPQLQQLSQQGLSEQHLQLLQKLQQQQAQLVSPSSPLLQPHILQQQQSCQQNPQLQQLPLSQPQQQFSGNNFLTSALMQSQQMPVVQSQIQSKPLTVARQLSGMTDGEAPSCSTSPSTNNCHVSPSDCPIRNQGPAIEVGDAVLEHSINTARDIDGKSDIRIKHEFPNSRGPEQVRFKSAVADQLEVSSLGTSYCLGAGNMQQNILLPQFRMDGDVQSHPQNCLSMTTNMDGLAPDTLLSRGYDSPKDFQNFLSAYNGSPKDIETELSAGSQPFGLPSMPFKPSSSDEAAINEVGMLNNGLWANQNHRMRTYTKVQKRGSVGRTIDVTHYKGYSELRRDLARMFGIEGQLEDLQRTDWKLVYVDHENDILLVGDDPWGEFVSCVQSIKILSSAEVQQMSLDGDLDNVPVPDQFCHGADSGNSWGVQYNNNCAASYN